MTISTQSSQSIFLGNNSTSVFTYNFVCDDPTTLQVLYNDGTTTITLSPSQYILFRNPPATNSLHSVGGTITYPTSGSPIDNGTSLTASRIVPLTQTDAISNQGDFYPQVVELALDELCLEIQQVSARTGQFRGVWENNISYNFGDIVQDGINGANTLNYYTCIMANTSNVWSSDLAAGDWAVAIDTAAIIGYANSAAASAATATTQAGIATTQAGIATTQAGIATTGANTATNEANIATSEANSAIAAAATATTGSSTATTQAGIATTAATTATTQAGIATTQAGIATTQATNAAASALLASSTITGTSTTTNTIGTGSFTFVTQPNKQFLGGQFIEASNGANYIAGTVTSYNATTGSLIIAESSNNGSGTFSSWNISVIGAPGTAGIGSGTVTSVSVVSANGLAGTVASASSTPAITLSTTVTGIVKGNGTTLSAATSGTDYSAGTSGNATGLVKNTTGTGILTTATAGTDYAPATTGSSILKASAGGFANAVSGTDFSAGTSALATGILKSTTSTGALSVAVAGDFPILNQNTSGNAATVTTNANLTGPITSAGNAVSTLTANNVLIGNGTSAIAYAPPVSSGYVLTDNGPGSNPTFQSPGANNTLTLLATKTASSSASLLFTSVLTSTYAQYLVVFNNLILSANTTIGLKLSSTNGSSYVEQLISQKAFITLGSSTAPTYTGVGGGGTTALIATLPGTTGQSFNGSANITCAQVANGFLWKGSMLNINQGGCDDTTVSTSSGNIINAFQLLPSSGTFTSGTVNLYGITK